MKRTEKITYEKINGEDKKVLKIFFDGVEKKTVITPDMRKIETEQKQEKELLQKNATKEKEKINLAWKSAATVEEKINVLSFVLKLNKKI